MPKLIFTSRYLRDASSAQLENYIRYIGTRKNYVDYIANRPRVERVGEHGLFTDAGVPVVLKKVQEDVVGHKGPVWTHVISLRREDAARLGYDSASQWMALLRSKRAMLCRHMKIDSANLRWYAAFHNESHHPHVHLMVYSAKDNEGYLTKQSIEAMRSELAHDIFRQDFANLYEEQNQARAALKSGTEDVLQRRMKELQSGTFVSAPIERMMLTLSRRLQDTSGKKVYGYRKRDVKNLVDQIVDELAKDPCVSELYQAWGKWQDEILLTYQNAPPPLPPLSQQKQFKSIKNMVIAEAVKLSGHHVLFEDERAQKLQRDGELEEIIPEEETLLNPDDLSEETELPEETLEGMTDKIMHLRLNGFQRQSPGITNMPNILWPVCITVARGWNKVLNRLSCFINCLPNREIHTLPVNWPRCSGTGLVRKQILGRQRDISRMRLMASLHWRKRVMTISCSTAWGGCSVPEPGQNGMMRWLRNIGNMRRGWEMSTPSMHWESYGWRMASGKRNQYAQYALGKLYLCGDDVPRDRERAVFYLQASAGRGNIYAQFLLDPMDSFHNPSAFLAATRLLHHLETLFQADYQKGTGGIAYHIDRKRRRKLAEKKQAQGHKRDDHEPVQQVY